MNSDAAAHPLAVQRPADAHASAFVCGSSSGDTDEHTEMELRDADLTAMSETHPSARTNEPLPGRQGRPRTDLLQEMASRLGFPFERMVEQVAGDFGEAAQRPLVESVIARLTRRFAQVPITAYVPILLRRAAREQIRATLRGGR